MTANNNCNSKRQLRQCSSGRIWNCHRQGIGSIRAVAPLKTQKTNHTPNTSQVDRLTNSGAWFASGCDAETESSAAKLKLNEGIQEQKRSCAAFG